MSADISQLPEGVPPLNSYYVYLTAGCNLACKHCWLSPIFQPNGGTGGHLDYDLFALAIEEALPLGLSHVKLTGGEPLLHPDFVKMVDLLEEKGLGLTIETNGTLLTRPLAKYLKEKSTLSFITVSLDGASAETHDLFRGVKGSFSRACNGIQYLVEAGYRPQVIMSVHAGNVDEIEGLVQMAEKMGAGSVKLGIAHSIGRGELMKRRGQLLDLQQLIELGEWVDTELKRQVRIPVYYNWPMAFYSVKNLIDVSGYTCNILHILGILPTGHLAMCGIGEHVPELCYGMIGEDCIADVWTSHPKLIDLRESLPEKLEGICGDCIFRDRCLGSCVAQCYYVSGRLTAPFWFCQQAEEAGIFPSSRRRSQV